MRIVIFLFLVVAWVNPVFSQDRVYEFIVDSTDVTLKKEFLELLNTKNDYEESSLNTLIKNFAKQFDLEIS